MPPQWFSRGGPRRPVAPAPARQPPGLPAGPTGHPTPYRGPSGPFPLKAGLGINNNNDSLPGFLKSFLGAPPPLGMPTF